MHIMWNKEEAKGKDAETCVCRGWRGLQIIARIWAETVHVLPVSDPVTGLVLMQTPSSWNWHDLPKGICKERLLGSENKLWLRWKRLRTRDISPPKDDLPNWKWEGHKKVQHYYGRWYEVFIKLVIICSLVTIVKKKKEKNQCCLNVCRGQAKENLNLITAVQLLDSSCSEAVYLSRLRLEELAWPEASPAE